MLEGALTTNQKVSMQKTPFASIMDSMDIITVSLMLSAAKICANLLGRVDSVRSYSFVKSFFNSILPPGEKCRIMSKVAC